MVKQSKRARKDANRSTLRAKSGAPQELALDMLLSDELKEQLGAASGGAALLVLPGSKTKHDKEKGAADLDPGEEEPLSKSQLRKLKQVQQKKERRDNIAQVVEQLNANALTDAQLALMRPIAMRGAKETKRQRLRRALRMERAGVTPDAADAAELYRPRKVEVEEEEEGSEFSEEEDTPLSATTVQLQQPGAAQPLPTAASQAGANKEGGSTSTSDEEGEEGAGRGAGPARSVLETVAAARAQIRREQDMQGVVHGDEDPEEVAQVAEGKRRSAVAAAEAAAVGGGPGGAAHRVVHVTRLAEIEESRRGLPIIGMEQEIIEAVAAHDVVVLCGETGCGKTTQVPQFLLEAGYGCTAFPERAGCVGVTQPRRVAATSTAGRVAHELGSELGATVGYQVRYDRAVGPTTRIKFMTDGILLRELQEDFLLRRYSVLLVDEAHERSLNTDLLLGMLSRVVPLRRKLCLQQRATPGYQPDDPDSVHPLKLIIMSATLRTEDFVGNRRLFPEPPPVVQVPARQYPVTVHFARNTEMHDYVGAAFRKVTRIHRELPPGGVLVFVTGQREVEHMCRKLRTHFAAVAKRRQSTPKARDGTAAATGDAATEDRMAQLQGGEEMPVPDAEELGWEGTAGEDRAELAEAAGGQALQEGDADEADDYSDMNDSGDEDEEEVQVLGGDSMTPEEVAEAEKRFEERLWGPGAAPTVGGGASEPGAPKAGPGPVTVLPLYAMLPSQAQARVFQPPPPGHRLIIVATNVAETSLTIPGIRYVVDAGRSKQRILDVDAGAGARFEVRWISQAASAQRAGRAGRTGPGHCYRLFSSAHYNDDLPQHSPPEIVNTALEGVALVLKAMGVDKVANFPFPTPPEPSALRAAEQCLVALGALGSGPKGALTPTGRAMAALPIGPRHARMLLEVAAWQLQMPGAAAAAAVAAGSRPPSAAVAAQALPYAIALAAALTIESPFMHIDHLEPGEGEGHVRTERRDGEEKGDEARERDEAAAQRAQRDQKAKQGSARSAQGKLRCAGSDALSVLRALCGYEAAVAQLPGSFSPALDGTGAGAAFCAAHFLHERGLKEAADLHLQLLRILAQLPANGGIAGGSLEATGGGALNLAVRLSSVVQARGGAMVEAVRAQGAALPAGVQDCLRRALAVGWADCVARRVRSAEHLARKLAAPGGKRHAVRYMSCALANAYANTAEAAAVAAQAARALDGEDLSGDVYLHPHSALHSAAPQYVVYAQLVRTERRPYMSGVTSVEPEWLVQCGTPLSTWSDPLADPAPVYRGPPVDAVMAWHDVKYGRHGWAMPRAPRPHPDAGVGAAVFAAALLEGKVLPGFSELRPALMSAPAVAARPEMQGVARVGELVGALKRANAASIAGLCRMWVRQPEFLQGEVAAWLPRAHHAQLAQLWPRMVQQALQEHEASRSRLALAGVEEAAASLGGAGPPPKLAGGARRRAGASTPGASGQGLPSSDSQSAFISLGSSKVSGQPKGQAQGTSQTQASKEQVSHKRKAGFVDGHLARADTQLAPSQKQGKGRKKGRK